MNALYHSPNFDERKQPITHLIIHYTGMRTGEGALERLLDPDSKVSAHFLVFEDGRILSLVDVGKRAWHAGVSFWDGIRDLNSASIGIEIVNPGHAYGYRAFPNAQIMAVTHLAHQLIEDHDIKPWHVLAHSDIAPARKQDPGEKFPWARLAEHGVGLWPVSHQHRPLDMPFIDGLILYGYEVVEPKKAIEAFHRHYYPERLGLEPDAESASRLAELIAIKLA